MKNKKNLVISIILSIILVIIVIFLIVDLINIRKKNDVNEEVSNSVNEMNNATIDNNLVNVENGLDENVNSVENKEEVLNEENKTTEISDPEQEIDKQTLIKQKTDEEKAISIAKNDWGEDQSVYFYYEGVSNNKHSVSVREIETTKVLMYYNINLDDGTFEVE